jgi:hypothetical protein
MSPDIHAEQALAFESWADKVGGCTRSLFERWADSKDFHPRDKVAIWAEVQRRQRRSA